MADKTYQDNFFSHSQQQTIDFAADFAKALKKGDIITLEGDLGAGKTHFVKGIAQGLGCDQLVTSPTFTLLNIYKGGRLVINHFDMYRLADAQEAQALGFDEYFDSQTLDGVSIVEWPENVDGLICGQHYVVRIIKTGEQERQITIGRAI